MTLPIPRRRPRQPEPAPHPGDPDPPESGRGSSFPSEEVPNSEIHHAVETHWKWDPENMSEEEKRVLEGLCKIMPSAKEAHDPEKVVEIILTMGLDEVNLGPIRSSLEFAKFLRSEPDRKRVLCYFQAQMNAQMISLIPKVWPASEPVQQCLSTVYDVATEQKECPDYVPSSASDGPTAWARVQAAA